MLICSSCGKKLTGKQVYYRDELLPKRKGGKISVEKYRRVICENCK